MSSPENQQNRIDILFYYSMHEYSGVAACFEHSNFFKVNLLASRDTRLRAPLNLQQKHGLQSCLSSMITTTRPLRSNYVLFNHNNFYIQTFRYDSNLWAEVAAMPSWILFSARSVKTGCLLPAPDPEAVGRTVRL